MERVLIIWALLIPIFLTVPRSNSVDDGEKKALVQFMDKLSRENAARKSGFGWNMSSDPCRDSWHGVFCDEGLGKIRRIVLEKIDLDGVFDAGLFCAVESVKVLSLQYNNITGNIAAEIENCKALTHLYLSGNKFSGQIPESLPKLRNLKRLHIANNKFYGDLPKLSRISGLTSFLAENNGLSGPIPGFDFSRFDLFNVSNNNFSGRIPDVKGKFGAESFLGNPYLCGKPLPNNVCPEKPKKFSAKQFFIYSGYVILGLVVLVFVIFKFLIKKKPSEEEEEAKKRRRVTQERSSRSNSTMPSTTASSEFKHGKSEYSLTITGSETARSLVVLESSAVASGLTFEELLKSPAELVGRGNRGSLYKVVLGNGTCLAVKRVKNWDTSCEDFDRKMRRIGQAKHRNVMPLAAYYCSRQEKLLVYEFQPNGSLFKLLHESQSGQAFDWTSRLAVASTLAEALSFMHEELRNIAHGNLKSSNIMFTKAMEPIISEYGLMEVEAINRDRSSSISTKTEDDRTADIYAFGEIILELLTGKVVQSNGFDLPNWVRSVVGEEWTVDVFDKALTLEGASEEKMLKLLQVALKCIDPSPSERPTMEQVSTMINAIKEDEEKSVSFAP